MVCTYLYGGRLKVLAGDRAGDVGVYVFLHAAYWDDIVVGQCRVFLV